MKGIKRIKTLSLRKAGMLENKVSLRGYGGTAEKTFFGVKDEIQVNHGNLNIILNLKSVLFPAF